MYEENITYKEKKYCSKCGKVCYTKREAQETINFFKRHGSKHRRVKKQKNIPVRYYYCDFCGCYHLTHLKTRYNNRLEKRSKYENLSKWEDNRGQELY